MEVSQLFINGSEVFITDNPIGLEDINISLDRDFQLSCIDTSIDVDLKFYCSSGKTEIDAEYEEKGIEANGYVIIIDTCGENEKSYRFNLDFKKYNNTGEYTTVGLIEVDTEIGDWKERLNKDVNLSQISGLEIDFWVRNLQLKYGYNSQNIYASLDNDTLNQEYGVGNKYIIPKIVVYDTVPPTPLPTPPPLPDNYYRYESVFIMPMADETLNELEESDGLKMDYFVTNNDVFKEMTFVDVSGTQSTITASSVEAAYSDIEPTPLFENKNKGGNFTITTDNSQLEINFKRNIAVYVELYRINEIIVVGKKYDSPRVIIKNQLSANTSIEIHTSPVILTYGYSKSYNTTIEVREDENVWIYYEVLYRDIIDNVVFNSPGWTYTLFSEIFFENMSYKFTNNIQADFKIIENTTATISSQSDIEPYHTKIKAFQGYYALNEIFGTDVNLAGTECFEDLFFSRGDYVRQKINRADFIVKPIDFFRELEKVVCCGIGVFHGTSAQLMIRSVFDFYTDNLPLTNQFDSVVDDIIEIKPYLANYYNQINIGYSNSKDTPLDLCKANEYSIDSNGESQYNKISDFIASQYIITKAIRLGTEDKELEYDKNIFIFSGKEDSSYNYTLSQTSGFASDDIIVSPSNYSGINRRYATVLNLWRHLYKWGFSLFPLKSKLTANKYEGNSIYTETIRDTKHPVNPNANYFGLSECMLPHTDFVNIDRTIDNITSDYILDGIYVPSVITFKTAKLTTLDIIELRKTQYDLFSVTNGTDTYYGNLISMKNVNDLTEITLLRRFKNGL